MPKAPENAMSSHEVSATLHTGFTVADLRATVRFLTECFGFKATEPHSPPGQTLSEIIGLDGAEADIAYVSTPNHQIELLQYRKPAPRTSHAPRPCDVGFAHIAFLVSDVEAMARRAASYGFRTPDSVAVIRHGRNAGKKATYLRDSHGFTVEIMSP